LVEIENCKEKCFAKLENGCAVSRCECRCFLYKPVDCKEWIKVIRDGKEWIMPPEEYYGM
jgi:hypothetical protein